MVNYCVSSFHRKKYQNSVQDIKVLFLKLWLFGTFILFLCLKVLAKGPYLNKCQKFSVLHDYKGLYIITNVSQ